MKVNMNNSLNRVWGVESIEMSPGKSELKEGPPSPSSAANLLRRPYPWKVFGVLPPFDPS
jgi:hypothetical protein